MRGCLVSPARASSTPVHSKKRRIFIVMPLLAPLIVLAPPPARAAPVRNQAVEDATSPLVQELLRRTLLKKEERKKERLNDYYRRNFSDYFSFEAGNQRTGISVETRAAIDKWLEENGDGPRRQAAALPGQEP